MMFLLLVQIIQSLLGNYVFIRVLITAQPIIESYLMHSLLSLINLLWTTIKGLRIVFFYLHRLNSIYYTAKVR